MERFYVLKGFSYSGTAHDRDDVTDAKTRG